MDQHTRGLALQTPESSTEDEKFGKMDHTCNHLEHASHALRNTRLLLEIGGNQRSGAGTFAIRTSSTSLPFWTSLRQGAYGKLLQDSYQLYSEVCRQMHVQSGQKAACARLVGKRRRKSRVEEKRMGRDRCKCPQRCFTDINHRR